MTEITISNTPPIVENQGEADIEAFAESLRMSSSSGGNAERMKRTIKDRFFPNEQVFFRYLLVLISLFVFSAITMAQERETGTDYYSETGYEQIDVRGQLEVTAPEILYSDIYTMALTVNIFDGTVTIYDLDGNGGADAVFSAHALVGQRLFLDSEVAQSLTAHADQVAGDDTGRYDPDRGVFLDSHGLRHTLTPPMIADFIGTARIDGFGGLPVRTDVAIIRSLGADGTTSTANSQFTFHEVPPLDNDHYRQRTRLLGAARSSSESVDDPYWSHGCVNMHPQDWREVKSILAREESGGGEVVIIFSTPGQNQSAHFRGPGYSGLDDPFFGDNLTERIDDIRGGRPTTRLLSPDDGELAVITLEGFAGSHDSTEESVDQPVNEEVQQDDSSDHDPVDEADNSSDQQSGDEQDSAATPTQVDLNGWGGAESFLNFSASERAPEQIADLPFFARKMISNYVEVVTEDGVNREQAAREGLQIWEAYFPDGEVNPSPRPPEVDSIYYAEYEDVSFYTTIRARMGFR